MKVEPLEPLFFFFIIKAEKVKPEFKVAFINEVWAYINFMSESQAEEYYEMLEKSLIKGKDFVAGLWEGAPWSELKPTPNDWIHFETSEGGCIATYIGDKY